MTVYERLKRAADFERPCPNGPHEVAEAGDSAPVEKCPECRVSPCYCDTDVDLIECSWCGGDGITECDDPIQCLDRDCNGELCRCEACDGRGHSQVVW